MPAPEAWKDVFADPKTKQPPKRNDQQKTSYENMDSAKKPRSNLTSTTQARRATANPKVKGNNNPHNHQRNGNKTKPINTNAKSHQQSLSSSSPSSLSSSSIRVFHYSALPDVTKEFPAPEKYQCRPRSSHGPGEIAQATPVVLRWHSPQSLVQLEIENEMLQIVLRWGKHERQMIWQQPDYRAREIRKACQRTGMHISAALSLRRSQLAVLNKTMTMERLQLGAEADIRRSAVIFEDCIAAALDRQQIPYWHEQEFKKAQTRPAPTPDFMLREPTRVIQYSVTGSWGDNTNDTIQAPKKSATNTYTIHWLECKMFYGAGTIRPDGKSAVGKLLEIAERYTQWYGPGAMVFSCGCSLQLAEQLAQRGVMVLDATGSETVDFGPLEEHQRTWCANDKGEILP